MHAHTCNSSYREQRDLIRDGKRDALVAPREPELEARNIADGKRSPAPEPRIGDGKRSPAPEPRIGDGKRSLSDGKRSPAPGNGRIGDGKRSPAPGNGSPIVDGKRSLRDGKRSPEPRIGDGKREEVRCTIPPHHRPAR